MNTATVYDVYEMIKPYIEVAKPNPDANSASFSTMITVGAILVFLIGAIMFFSCLEEDLLIGSLIGVVLMIIPAIFIINGAFDNFSDNMNAILNTRQANITDYLEIETREETIELATLVRSSDVLNNIDSSINVLTKSGVISIKVPKTATFEAANRKEMIVEYAVVTASKIEGIPQDVLDKLKEKKIDMRAKLVYLDPGSDSSAVQQNININAQDNANVTIDNSITTNVEP